MKNNHAKGNDTRRKKTVWMWLLVFLTAISLGLFAIQSQKQTSQEANNTTKSTAEPNQAIEKVEKIVIAAPKSAVSYPLIHMIENNALADTAQLIEYRQWKNHSQMRAMVLKGDIDFIAIPTNVVATLYNKGVDIQLLNVSVWDILYIISNDDSLSDIQQLKQKEIIMPFRGDMPDIIMQRLLQLNDIKVDEEIQVNYVANALTANKLLMSGRADYAVLVEPAISMVLTTAQNMPNNSKKPRLYRSINIQQQWGKTLDSKPRIPQAGIALINPNLDKKIVNRFIDEYNKSAQWTKQNPKDAAKSIVQQSPMLTEEAVISSIKHTGLDPVAAQKAKPELNAFFAQIAQLDNKLIGGKLPDDKLYYISSTD